jgi:DNA-binding beta-propeller fold protein YncE
MAASALRELRRGVALAVLSVFLLAATQATADAKPSRSSAQRGGLTQLKGDRGCIGAPSARPAGCATARALRGPGPFMGSRAIAVSPDGNNVYVASSTSNAIAIFDRNKQTGALSQPSGKAGCIAIQGGAGCARAVGLIQPNSIAISGNGRNVYATSRAGNSVTSFARNRKTGALRQLPGGCISGLPLPACTTGQALVAPDVVVISRDGKNVYAGSFFGNSVAVFTRDASTGGLSQPAGAAGCIAEATTGCATGIALGAVEGLAISADGSSVYTGSALSNAVAILTRDPSTGALTQATDGSGCIVDAPLTGCTTGVQLAGANAVALSPGDKQAYVTSLLSNSVTSFNHGTLTQKQGTAACLVFLRAVGCSFGRAMSAPEGIVVAPDGKNVYVAAFTTGAIDVLNRNRATGRVAQKPGHAGCLGRSLGCKPARATRGASSVVVSPDGRFVYATAFYSNAVDVFRRKG